MKTLLIAVLLALSTHPSIGQFKNFITTKGDRLMDGEAELRFISCNVPNLHYVEDNLPFNGTDPWRLPDEFEIRDALTAIKQMGGKVARVYVFSVKKESDLNAIAYVEGPGKFNEEAFRTFDKVLQIANEVGIRLIVPFVDNWLWWGGPKEYALFRGKPRDAFWTDAQLISDFEKTIEFVIHRTNTYTGVPYIRDKAVLAWETGNEIVAPFSWTKTVAAYIKSLDKNHLVLEGTLGRELTADALNDPNLDILSSHHYRDPKSSIEFIVKNRQMAKGKKPYIVGEYGIVPTEDIRTMTDTIINQGVTGAMIWSLRFRSRDGGFYYHYEYNNTEAYRWPGFPSGDFYDERTVMTILREKAHEIDGSTTERLPVPAAPRLLDIQDAAAISWQGSAGAQWYGLERKGENDTGWTVLGSIIDDARFQYRPNYSDESADVGRKYFYRVQAKNETGRSEYSNVVGPVSVTSRVMVDEMEDLNRVFQKDGALRLLTTEDIRRAKEDRSRLAGDSGSYIIYKLSSKGIGIKIDYFITDSTRKISVAASNNLGTFSPIVSRQELFSFGKNDYGYFDAVTLTSSTIPDDAKYIRIALSPGVQLSRVELRTQ